MRALALRFLILAAVAMALWWPVADRHLEGPWLITHAVFPAAFALVALLAWRMLRSLVAAVACAAAIAVVAFLMYRYLGDAIRPLVERLWR